MTKSGGTSLSSHALLLYVFFSAEHKHAFTFIVFVNIVSASPLLPNIYTLNCQLPEGGD